MPGSPGRTECLVARALAQHDDTGHLGVLALARPLVEFDGETRKFGAGLVALEPGLLALPPALNEFKSKCRVLLLERIFKLLDPHPLALALARVEFVGKA